ncbi:LYSozyme [Caenorhabditis elegans]|uniref:LYSozyme n=1 Tax=Caenorhabditis elegans TaxID=6239 RepID=O61518_CAEEL|nr:LYSozyme [Caenorhabditis elegans]CCD68532.1 LYSozyme [Caenorhabditis elegans]|eukprot:NP_501405.1 LYSozyme [Caenorhabditis elegans]
MKLLIVLLILVTTINAAKNGIDFIQPVSVETFKCIHKDGYSFVIPRVFTSVGTLDHTGIQNVKHAREGNKSFKNTFVNGRKISAGLTDVDGYIFPCLASHCPSAANQVKETLDALKSAGTHVSTLWLDIERLAWPANHAHNRAFIEEMVKEAEARKQHVGIYSNYYNWQDIVGLDYHGQSHLMLWWATYDGIKDFSKFVAFGGWKKPTIHQWHGTTKGPCGVSVDLNYVP